MDGHVNDVNIIWLTSYEGRPFLTWIHGHIPVSTVTYCEQTMAHEQQHLYHVSKDFTLSLILTSAFAATKALTTSNWPIVDAHTTAVLPSYTSNQLSHTVNRLWLMSNNNYIMSVRAFTSSLILTSAFAATKALTTSKWPLSDANIRAVFPSYTSNQLSHTVNRLWLMSNNTYIMSVRDFTISLILTSAFAATKVATTSIPFE